MHLPRFRPLLLVGVLAVTTVAACGGDDDDSSSAEAPTAADLDGKSFVATDVEGFTIVDGSEIVLTFADGNVQVQAGCNGQNGAYEVTDGTLQVGAMMGTMMACDDALMAQDQTVATLLTAAPTIALDGGELTIATDDTSMTLSESS